MSDWIKPTPTISAIFTGSQADAQIWEKLRWTSGGKLNIAKCKFHVLCWSLRSKAKIQAPPLLLREGAAENSHEVAQPDLDDPFKTPGIHKTLSGNQDTKIQKIKQNSNAHARGILSVNVTQFEAWTGLFAIWFGQRNCPLAATSFTKVACQKIDSNAINASLSKCGSSCKTDQAIVFGSPPWVGGSGWHHLCFEQGI
jgi:hypothetical protein